MTACYPVSADLNFDAAILIFVYDILRMFSGLGKYLRACGIDTVILQGHEAHVRCVDIAVQDNRFIITTKTTYNLVKNEEITSVWNIFIFTCSWHRMFLMVIAFCLRCGVMSLMSCAQS